MKLTQSLITLAVDRPRLRKMGGRVKGRALGALFAALALAGCAGVQRGDPGAFRTYAETKVPAGSQARLVDCLVDGFEGARGGFMSVEIRQLKREDGYRVETYSHRQTSVSVDVLNSGTVAMYEREDFKGRFTGVQREAFDKCTGRTT